MGNPATRLGLPIVISSPDRVTSIPASDRLPRQELSLQAEPDQVQASRPHELRHPEFDLSPTRLQVSCRSLPTHR